MSKLAANTTYVFRVRDFNDAGGGDYSRPAACTTPPAPLPTPTLTCTLSPSGHDAVLEWRAMGADSYEVQAAAVGESQYPIACEGRVCNTGSEFVRLWLGAESTVSVDVSTLPPGSGLQFRVRCRGTKDSLSPFSAIQTLTIPLPPPPPSERTVVVRASSKRGGLRLFSLIGASLIALVAIVMAVGAFGLDW